MLLRSRPHWLIVLLSAQTTLAQTDAVSIPMIKGKSTRMYLVDGTLSDRYPGLFLIDTGASETVLAEWFVKEQKLPLSKKRGAGKDSGGRKPALGYTKVNGLAFGTAVDSAPRDVPVVALPAQFRQLRIVGIMSPQSHFAGKPFTLDFPEREIRIHAGSNAIQLGTEVEIKTVNPCPDSPKKMVVTAYANDLEGKFYLDTGEVHVAVTEDFARRMQGNAASPSPSTSPRKGAATARKVTRLKAIPIRFGSMNERFPVDVEPGAIGCAAADGKLGIDLLGQFRLSFSADRTSVQLSR